jgi:hypothetical protein
MGIPPAVVGLRAGLKAEGFAEGRHVVLEQRFTSGNLQALSQAARELVAAGVDGTVLDALELGAPIEPGSWRARSSFRFAPNLGSRHTPGDGSPCRR